MLAPSAASPRDFERSFDKLPMTRRFGLPFQGKRSSYWATEGVALGYDGTAFQAGLSTSCPANNPAHRFEGLRMTPGERGLAIWVPEDSERAAPPFVIRH